MRVSHLNKSKPQENRLTSCLAKPYAVCHLSVEAEWRGCTGPPDPAPRCGSPPAAVLPIAAPLPPGYTPAGGAQRTRHVPYW